MNTRRGNATALGRWLAMSRERTYKWLAAEMGVSRQTAMNWAVARVCPSSAHAKELARVTGLSLADLLVDAKGPPAKRGRMSGPGVMGGHGVMGRPRPKGKMG